MISHPRSWPLAILFDKIVKSPKISGELKNAELVLKHDLKWEHWLSASAGHLRTCGPSQPHPRPDLGWEEFQAQQRLSGRTVHQSNGLGRQAGPPEPHGTWGMRGAPVTGSRPHRWSRGCSTGERLWAFLLVLSQSDPGSAHFLALPAQNPEAGGLTLQGAGPCPAWSRVPEPFPESVDAEPV